MLKDRTAPWRSSGLALLLAAALVGVGLATPAQVAAPVVKVVPWVAANPLVPHDTYPGKTVTLKGTTDATAAQYYWDYGDGSAPQAWTAVSNRYALEAAHAYTASATFPLGTVFTARLYVKNAGGETAYQNYFVKLQLKTLAVEVNVAIDEGLWYLHKSQTRTVSSSMDVGYWNAGYVGSGYYSVSAANTNAFEVNGHLENGSADNPYTETVARGLRYVFLTLTQGAITSRTNPLGTFSPDGNGNGTALYVNQGYPFYQGGMLVDVIVASGTPTAIVQGGPLVGRTYLSVVQDMVDGYAYCQYTGGTVSPAYGGGGWRYNCGDWPDNSPSQWGAIAIIPAVREWSVVLNPIVPQWNKTWLKYSWDGHGFGYTDPGYYPWGPYAVTPSGMVQMVMDGIGRGDPMWDATESWMRDNFGNGGGVTSSIKSYYYGLFSFVKSLLLSPCPTPATCDRDPGDTTPYGIKLLKSSTAGVVPIDWYGAEVANGAPTDGIARRLVNDQNASGYWYGHNYDGNQYVFETAWAIMMLNRVVFTGGAPVAVGVATPNPAVTGAAVTLDGTGSYHQDPARHIVQWDWDVNNDGVFELHGPIVTFSWGSLNTYPVTLRVTDDASSPATATTIFNVLVTIPPIAPTANAGGPYNFCPQTQPWFLDGSKSVNPDEGQHQAGAPGDTIYGAPSQFSWNLGVAFGDAVGVKPNVTTFFNGKVGSFLVTLKVTDTTATSFPSSGQPNLSSTATAQVFVRASTDPQCASCITDLKSVATNKLVQVKWSLYGGADHYNIYRSTTSGGPYTKIGKALGTQTLYLDGTVTNGVTYYYVVRPATIAELELCQSNQVMAKPIGFR